MIKLTKFCNQTEIDTLVSKYHNGTGIVFDGVEYICTSYKIYPQNGIKIQHEMVMTLREKKKEWWEDIPEHGYLCKVWDQGDKEEHKCVEFVVDHNDTPFRYITETGELWEYAVPLTQEEVAKYTYTEGDS